MFYVLPLDYEGKIPYMLLDINFTAFKRYSGIADHVLTITDQVDNVIY